jgi:Fic family protein
VAANLAAVSEAIEEAHAGPLTVESLRRWHRTLMTRSPTPTQHVGVLRTEQGWIGGTSLLDAHLVTRSPEEVPPLVDDLVEFVNRDDVDPVSQAAIAHAQFEVIHPFADGNGRVGRVLVAWILVRRLSLVVPPPVSARIAADVGGYGSGLVLFRMGDLDAWVRWFADAVSGAGRAQRELIASVERLRREWHERLSAPREGSRRVRSDAAAWRTLDLLPRHLVLTGPVVASELAVPLKTANAALRDLVDAGILVEQGTVQRGARGRPSRLYASAELLGLAESTRCAPERGSAVGGGGVVAFEDVVGEQPGDELAAAGDAALGEDRLDVVVDGVAGDAHLGGDLLGRQPPGEERHHLRLALGEAVGLEDDGDEVGRAGGLDDDGDLVLAEWGGVEAEPAARAAAGPHRDPVGVLQVLGPSRCGQDDGRHVDVDAVGGELGQHLGRAGRRRHE